MKKIIIEDTRNQVGKHKLKKAWFAEKGIKVERHSLPVGDYVVSNDYSIAVDTKKDLQELCGNVCQQHKRFVEELMRAEEYGIKLYILCEHGEDIACLEDVQGWENPRIAKSPKALAGEKLYKILKTMEKRHGCKFEFCCKEDAGRRIAELLQVSGLDG